MKKIRIRGLICIILISCLTCSVASADSYWNLSLNENADNTSKSSGRSDQYYSYNRNVVTGYFIALVPGFFVHGLGNMYAENYGAGLMMLGLEAASLGVFIIAAAINSDEGSDNMSIKFDAKSSVLAYVSLGLFLGSWVWDFITVGGEIEKRQKRKKVQVMFGQLPTFDSRNDPAFGLNLSISF